MRFDPPLLVTHLVFLLATLSISAQDNKAATVTFLHFHKGERIGTTVLTSRDMGNTLAECTVLNKDVSYRPLGMVTRASCTFDMLNRPVRYRIAAISKGLFSEQKAEIPWPEKDGRSVVSRTIKKGHRHRSRSKVPLLKQKPLLVLDLNLLAPLVRFCLGKKWRPTYNALSQTSRIQVLCTDPDRESQVEEAIWEKRTSRERLPVEDKVISCQIFALHLGDRTILFSVATGTGDLMKIEEPGLGYVIKRSFTNPPAPEVRGFPVHKAFDRLKRFKSKRVLGLSLGDRTELEAVTYSVSIPFKGTSLPRRSWQSVEGTLAGGRLTATLKVTAGGEGRAVTPKTVTPKTVTPKTVTPDSPPEKKDEEEEKPAPEILMLARTLRAGAPEDRAFLDAVGRHCAEKIGFVFNIEDPLEAVKTGFGNVKAKALLAAGLIKAEGLPLRTVTGLICTGSAFVPHRWIEVYLATEKAWIPLDPTFGEVGSLSPLHLTLGTPWALPGESETLTVCVKSFRYKPGKKGDPGRVRWPDGEKRVYGFAKCMPDGGEKLFGYLASTPRRDKQDEIRFTTDLILDYTRAGLKGYFEGKASSIFDASGRPLWFSLQTWRGGKRYTFVTRITASEASIQETGGGKTLVKLESGSILFFESLHNHWSLFFSRLDPALIKRMPIHVLVLQHKRLYRWNLIHRGREEVLVPALDKTVNAHIFDVPERNFRFWVTDARVLVKVEDRRAEITVRLEKESLRERF